MELSIQCVGIGRVGIGRVGMCRVGIGCVGIDLAIELVIDQASEHYNGARYTARRNSTKLLRMQCRNQSSCWLRGLF